MERLTERSKNSDMVWLKDHENGNMRFEPCEMTAHHSRMAIEKLVAYEDAEEQELLLRLPCKVGDILYFVYHKEIIVSVVLSVKYHAETKKHGVFIHKKVIIDFKGAPREFNFCDIGKRYFLPEMKPKQS